MNRQLSLSPKLTTLSLDLELTSSLKRFDAWMYSTSSWHWLWMSCLRASLRSASRTEDSAAARWSLQMSWMMPLASCINSAWVASAPQAASMFRSRLYTSRSLLVVPVAFLPELRAEQTTAILLSLRFALRGGQFTRG